MVDHYEGNMSVEDYEKDYNEALELVFGEIEKGVWCSLDSLEGIVEVGFGKDEQEAREDYLEKIYMLRQELKEKELRIMYDMVNLNYNKVGEL